MSEAVYHVDMTGFQSVILPPTFKAQQADSESGPWEDVPTGQAVTKRYFRDVVTLATVGDTPHIVTGPS